MGCLPSHLPVIFVLLCITVNSNKAPWGLIREWGLNRSFTVSYMSAGR